MNGFPLKIVPTETREAEADFNAEFCVHMLPKMEWEAFVNAAKEIGIDGFPSEIPDDAAETILTVGDATKFLEKNAKS